MYTHLRTAWLSLQLSLNCFLRCIAASVMEYGSYDDQPVDYDMMIEAEKCYFPEIPEDTLFHVSEYEASMRDAMWR